MNRWNLVLLLAAVALPQAARSGPPPPFLRKWGLCCAGAMHFRDPRGIAVGPGGVIYVTDVANQDARKCVQKFDAQGNFLTMWGTGGTGDGQFIYPTGIAVGPDATVYVADSDRIQRFDPYGNFLGRWGVHGAGDGEFNNADELAVSASGQVYVADRRNHRIQRFDANGHFITKWGSVGSGPGQFQNPEGIVVDGSGNVYVVDNGTGRIEKFDASGTFLLQWGTAGSAPGQLQEPVGIAIDANKNIYVAETGAHRVDIFDGILGVYSARLGSTTGDAGSADGQFAGPWGVAVDPAGHLFVVDSGNYRIQEFGSSATVGIESVTWDQVKKLYRN